MLYGVSVNTAQRCVVAKGTFRARLLVVYVINNRTKDVLDNDFAGYPVKVKYQICGSAGGYLTYGQI